MRQLSKPRNRFRPFDFLEPRSLLSTLIALVDSGVDLASATDSPYYDFSAAYDAFKSRFATLVETVRTWGLYPAADAGPGPRGGTSA